MPFKARRPAGGFRVMYEYANRLSDLGYSIRISYSLKTKYIQYRFPYWIRLILSYIEGFRTNKWFDFRSNIDLTYIKSVSNKYIEDADVVIATWWSTAYDMGDLSESKGKKINLIQGYENWEGAEDLLHSSYNMKGVTNIAVATYLKDIITKFTNKPVHIIPNAIDTNLFKINNSIEHRTSTAVCMLYSIQEIKGSKYGLEALKIVKEKYPELEVTLFGVCPEPENLPDWMKFYRNPLNLSNIYNEHSIFISNSFTEGMALTPMEAMACGCAVICTDIPGHQEYAFDGDTALLVPAGEAETMAQAIIQLIENNQLRTKIAQQGNLFVQRFSWNVAVEKMNHLIKSLLNEDTSNR